jgi:hypothetical protein
MALEPRILVRLSYPARVVLWASVTFMKLTGIRIRSPRLTEYLDTSWGVVVDGGRWQRLDVRGLENRTSISVGEIKGMLK